MTRGGHSSNCVFCLLNVNYSENFSNFKTYMKQEVNFFYGSEKEFNWQ